MEAEKWLIENDELLSEEELNEYIKRINAYTAACKVSNKIKEMKENHNSSNVDYENDEIKAFDNLIKTKSYLDEYYLLMKQIHTNNLGR